MVRLKLKNTESRNLNLFLFLIVKIFFLPYGSVVKGRTNLPPVSIYAVNGHHLATFFQMLILLLLILHKNVILPAA